MSDLAARSRARKRSFETTGSSLSMRANVPEPFTVDADSLGYGVVPCIADRNLSRRRTGSTRVLFVAS